MIDRNKSSVYLECACIGSECRSIVSGKEGPIGTVLNVFDRTINIKTEDDKLFVITLGKIASPLTANIVTPTANPCLPFSSFTDLIQTGDSVAIAGNQKLDSQFALCGQVRLGHQCTVFLNRSTQIFENEFVKVDLHKLLKFSDHMTPLFHLLKELAYMNTKGCLLNPDVTTDGLLSDFLIKLFNDEKNGLDFGSMSFAYYLSHSLFGMCGCGPGFTPAGDDFISGFLTVLNRILIDLKIGVPIIPGSEFRNLTTWTSFKLMESNARGLVDGEIQNLINCIATGDILSYAYATRQLSKKGHTSGLDFVTGATVAVYLATYRVAFRPIDQSLMSILGNPGPKRESIRKIEF